MRYRSRQPKGGQDAGVVAKSRARIVTDVPASMSVCGSASVLKTRRSIRTPCRHATRHATSAPNVSRRHGQRCAAGIQTSSAYRRTSEPRDEGGERERSGERAAQDPAGPNPSPSPQSQQNYGTISGWTVHMTPSRRHYAVSLSSRALTSRGRTPTFGQLRRFGPSRFDAIPPDAGGGAIYSLDLRAARRSGVRQTCGLHRRAR